MSESKTLYVYYDGGKPIKIGRLYINYIRGEEQFSFEYTNEFFSSSIADYFFDADIYPYRGRQFLPDGKRLFGVFSDSAPDRWGRVLMRRREGILANTENRKPKKLYESDYLTGVYDEARMGALRFSLNEDGVFLSDEKEQAIPPFESLRSLEEAAREFERDENLLNGKWLKQLIVPGSSLGGARPKATVKDVDGGLWVAKFPSRNDEYDIGAWEKTVQDLAKLCGLNVAETKLVKFSKLGSTFLSKRFDRNGNKRVHFISSMTALGKTDGASAADGTSYLDIVSFIKAHGASPKRDLRELFRRIIFSIAITNTDDHLRNHGFILSNDGWHLSPVYDVNPTPYGENLALNIDYSDNSLSFENALNAAEYFNLEKNEAQEIIFSTVETVSDKWQLIASKNGISKSSMDYMRPAFNAKV